MKDLGRTTVQNIKQKNNQKTKKKKKKSRTFTGENKEDIYLDVEELDQDKIKRYL
jgi:hypothetical protein